MHINEHAVGFAAYSLARVLAAELLRKGILDHQEFVSAILNEIVEQRKVDIARNQDTATLLSVYVDEISVMTATRQ
jgi:hypothetical protein